MSGTASPTGGFSNFLGKFWDSTMEAFSEGDTRLILSPKEGFFYLQKDSHLIPEREATEGTRCFMKICLK